TTISGLGQGRPRSELAVAHSWFRQSPAASSTACSSSALCSTGVSGRSQEPSAGSEPSVSGLSSKTAQMSSASPWGRSIGERTSNSGGSGSVVSAALELGESGSLAGPGALGGPGGAAFALRGGAALPAAPWVRAEEGNPPSAPHPHGAVAASATSASAQVRLGPEP